MHTASESVNGSSVEEWLRSRLAAPRLSNAAREALTNLLDGEFSGEEASDTLLLTVVMRSQVKRWEQLQDALLCLAAQTDTDFELLLMLHNVTTGDAARVQRLIDSYPRSFSTRVRVIEVAGGGRARPLNASLEEARGAYVAFFDDDDLLMANWVEAFREGTKKAPGQLIRTNVATQENSAERWIDGSAGQRTVGLVKAEYARYFNFIDNFERNHTPFMGFAFPRTFFSFWGERFDEGLPVCEDWDVAVRAVQLIGVHSSGQITAIYRQWKDTQTSYTSHDREEWQEAEQRVRAKITASPFLAPVSLVSDFLAVVERFRKNEELMFQHQTNLVSSTTWRIMEPVRASLRFMRRFTRR